jgi:hypothetical protein
VWARQTGGGTREVVKEIVREREGGKDHATIQVFLAYDTPGPEQDMKIEVWMRGNFSSEVCCDVI